MVYYTPKSAVKYVAVAYLCNLITTLKENGKHVLRVWLVPEDVPTGWETYQYAVEVE